MKMSRKLDASLKKIDDVFGQMHAKGITVSDKKDGWGDKTVTTYADMVKSLVTEVHSRYGVADLGKITESQVKDVIMDRASGFYKGDTKESFNVKTLVSAVKAFTKGAAETNVLKGKDIHFGNMDTIRQELKDSNFVRHSKSSSIMRATPEQCEKVLSNIREQGYKTPIRELAYNVSKISYETGGRISGVLKLRPQDIDFKNNTVTFHKDKGGLSRTVKISPETTKTLQELSVGKKGGQMIFGAKNKDGKFKSVTETRKAIERVVSIAGRELQTTEKVKTKDQNGKRKIVEVEKRFTPHAFRKGAAVNRAKEYYDRLSSKTAIKNYVKERSKDRKIAQKLEVYRKFINKDRKRPRALTREEYAIFFTSVDLGHYRADVINNYYTTMKEVLAYFDK